MMIGAHVSSAGGLEKSLERAEALGAEAMQTFASSPRMLKFTPPTNEAIARYITKRAQSQVKYHIFHGIYLVNLAHVNPEYVKVCVEALTHCQLLAGKIGAAGTIFHIGSHKGLGLTHYLPQIAQAIAEILAASPPGVKLLLENAAGQYGTIGESWADLQTIMKAVKDLGIPIENLGIGMDTQHAFASGYDIRTDTGLNTLLSDIEMTVGLASLRLIHINDSAVPLGSHKDRHANVGEGEIGTAGIARVLTHPYLQHLPMILEVPGDKAGPREEDVARLKDLAVKAIAWQT